MRERTQQLTFFIGLVLIVIFGSITAVGQGGTGKATANANSSKTGASTNKSRGNTTKRESSNERSYVPTGPTAKDLIFLREFLKSYGAFEGGVQYSFSPVDRCKARITVDGLMAPLGRRFRTYTFLFSDIDAGRIRAELSTTAAGYFDSVHLASTDDRKVIEEKSGNTFSSSNKDQLPKQTDRFSFSFRDSAAGENQNKVIKALKNLIEICLQK